jgi:hypothetical protein
MIEAVVAVVAVTAAGGTSAGLIWRDRLLRRRVKDVVIANMKSGTAFKGVLVEADGRSLILRNAEALRPGDERLIPVDGEVLVSRADVEFLQRP